MREGLREVERRSRALGALFRSNRGTERLCERDAGRADAGRADARGTDARKRNARRSDTRVRERDGDRPRGRTMREGLRDVEWRSRTFGALFRSNSGAERLRERDARGADARRTDTRERNARRGDTRMRERDGG